MMNLKPAQIIVIGAGITFGLPVIVGLIVGHFFGSRPGMGAGLLVFLCVLVLAYRQFMKKVRQQEKETKDDL